MKKKIYFRADASVDIGYGHFIRTLALASILKEHFDCIFFTVAPSSYQRTEIEKVCRCEVLCHDTHFEDFLSYINGNEIVVLDNYFFDTLYQQKIKEKGSNLVCIDDMHDKHYVADIVINHAINESEKFSVEPYTQLCLGYDWALLRKPFYDIVPSVVKESGSILNVAICFGGSDLYDFTDYFAQILLREKNIYQIQAIVGDGYQARKQLSSSKIQYLRNLSAKEMANVFHSVDLVILSASTVCLEALSCQALVAAGYYVENQKEVYADYVRERLVLPLGDLRDLIKNDFLTLSNILEPLRKIGNLRRLVGFENIPLNYIRLFCNSFDIKNYEVNGLFFVDYRNLSENQHKEIWQIRNHASIRCWMEHPELISWESHRLFVSRLSHSYRKLYWGIYKSELLIGSVNIEFITSTQVERGIFLHPNYIEQSLGREVERALSVILHNLHITTITAKVLKKNPRSLHFHIREGYTHITSDDKYDYLLKQLRE